MSYNVSEGYWRESLNSSFVECLYGSHSCTGGSSVSSGDSLCAAGFDAALCGKCDSIDKYMNYLTVECYVCTNSALVSIGLLVIPLLLIVPIVVMWSLHQKTTWIDKRTLKSSLSQKTLAMNTSSMECNSHDDSISRSRTITNSRDTEENADIVNYKIKRSPSYIAQLQREQYVFSGLTTAKILISSCQISYAIPQNLRVIPPTSASLIIQLYGWISIASPAAYPLYCLVPTLTFQTIMELSTLAPLIIIALYSIFFTLEIEWKKLSRIRSNALLGFHRIEVKYYTVFLLVLFISLGAVCYSAIGSIGCVDINPSNSYFVLRNDVYVHCSSDLYKLGVGWGVIALLVYLFIYPIYILYWLVKHRDEIINRFDISEFNLIDFRLDNIVNDVNVEIKSFHKMSQQHERIKLFKSVNRQAKKFCVSAISKYQFIFSAYRKSMWYWEVIETVKRIVFMCLLSIAFDLKFISLPNTLPLLLLLSGMFLLLTSLCRPYGNWIHNLFAIASDIQSFALIACLSRDSTNDKLVTVVVLICPIVTVVIVLWLLLRCPYTSNKNNCECSDDRDNVADINIDVNDVVCELDIADDELEDIINNNSNDRFVDDDNLHDNSFDYSIFDTRKNDSRHSGEEFKTSRRKPHSLPYNIHYNVTEEYNESFSEDS